MTIELKHCPLCGQNLPFTSFTSVRARCCINCSALKRMQQLNAMRQRAFERMKNKKQKTKVVQNVASLKKSVQRLVNKYIRQRDAGLKCISCQKSPQTEAGHYINQGSTGALRYDFDNIHGQCTNCNKWLSGNKIEYRIHLVEKIGEAKVRELEAHRHDTYRWRREELEELSEVVKELLHKKGQNAQTRNQ